MGEREQTKQGVETREYALFAAANSGEGFKSFYGEIFSPERLLRRYLIKGGAGSGKSSLMRRVAQAVSSRGHCVEYYYCSSDPNSLDGITISDMGISFIDGTAPHVYEPTCVGAFEEIINLGAFWNRDVLFGWRWRRRHCRD